MTILNVHVRPDRVLMGMDTVVSNTHDGTSFETSKFGVIPEANVVVAWRGERLVHSNIFLECFAARVAVHLDFLVETLPALIPEKIRAVRDDVAERGAPADIVESPLLGEIELVLAGWSVAAAGMRAVRLSMRPGEHTVGVHPIDEAIISQGDMLDPSEVLVPGSIGGMERLAKSQLAAAARHGVADRGFGGHFLIVELSQHEIRIRRRAIFPRR